MSNVVVCPACGRRCQPPAAPAGQTVRCSYCGQPLHIHPAAPTASPDDSADERPAPTLIKFRCARCDARLKVPAGAVHHKARCPRCAAVLRVPRPAPRPATVQPDSQTGPTCPSCGQSLPPGAQICVDCGIRLKSGRSLLITQDENLDQICTVARGTIRLISWLMWIGVYPVASEAFGMKKPHVVRGLILATCVISIGFLGLLWTDAAAMSSLVNLALWSGDPGQPQEASAWHGEFHAAQLLTHAFLHGGLVHLAGNMLFLAILGGRVNALVGNLWTGPIYLLLAVVAGVAHMIATAHEPLHPVLGASGAVMGLAGMYLVLFPAHKLHMMAWLRWIMFLFLFPVLALIPPVLILLLTKLSLKSFTMRGFWVVLFYIAFDVIYTVFGLEDDVAHWAHLGGFIGGIAVAALLLLTRRVNARGGDLFSVVLGRHAWRLVGRPRA